MVKTRQITVTKDGYYDMNKEYLNELIRYYEENFDFFNNDENKEYFKWAAVKRFRDTWLSDTGALPFHEMLKEALSESSVLIDNGTTHPANGIVEIAKKLDEKDSDELIRLFRNVLYADDGGDIDLRQDHMEQFLVEANRLKEQEFPASWKYNQDRHAVSCYLALLYPEENFIYKYSVAEAFAQAIEFGFDIGSGESFRLKYYYDMCDQVVEELRNHEELLKRHEALLDENCYHDESLHLLAFDVIYCATAYHFVNRIENHMTKKDAIRAEKQRQLEEQQRQERERKMAELQDEIIRMQDLIEPVGEISLVGVRVSHKRYGDGVVVEQDDEKKSTIKVQFQDEAKKFKIDKSFLMRPVFEDDEEIVEIFTEYNQNVERLEKLQKELERL